MMMPPLSSIELYCAGSLSLGSGRSRALTRGQPLPDTMGHALGRCVAIDGVVCNRSTPIAVTPA
jgi:hypothetical protein